MSKRMPATWMVLPLFLIVATARAATPEPTSQPMNIVTSQPSALGGPIDLPVSDLGEAIDDSRNTVVVNVRAPQAWRTSDEAMSMWPVITVVLDGAEKPFPAVETNPDGRPPLGAKHPLYELLRTMVKADPTLRVIIRGEKDAPYMFLAPVLVSCADAGARKLCFETTRPPAGTQPADAPRYLLTTLPVIPGTDANAPAEAEKDTSLVIRVDSMRGHDQYIATLDRVQVRDAASLSVQLLRLKDKFAAAGTTADQVQVVINPNHFCKYQTVLNIVQTALQAGFKQINFHTPH